MTQLEDPGNFTWIVISMPGYIYIYISYIFPLDTPSKANIDPQNILVLNYAYAQLVLIWIMYSTKKKAGVVFVDRVKSDRYSNTNYILYILS